MSGNIATRVVPMEGLCRHNVKCLMDEAYNKTEFICKVNPDNFPKISFFDNPIKYLRIKSWKNTYNKVLNEMVRTIMGELGLEKYFALHSLSIAKDIDAKIPAILSEEMEKNPKESYENYLGNLESEF